MSGEAPDCTIEARMFAKHIAQAPENTERNELLAKRVMELSYALGRKEGIEEAAKVVDDNMLCSSRSGDEVLLARGSSGNRVWSAYATAIRQLLEVKG